MAWELFEKFVPVTVMVWGAAVFTGALPGVALEIVGSPKRTPNVS